MPISVPSRRAPRTSAAVGKSWLARPQARRRTSRVRLRTTDSLLKQPGNIRTRSPANNNLTYRAKPPDASSPRQSVRCRTTGRNLQQRVGPDEAAEHPAQLTIGQTDACFSCGAAAAQIRILSAGSFDLNELAHRLVPRCCDDEELSRQDWIAQQMVKMDGPSAHDGESPEQFPSLPSLA